MQFHHHGYVSTDPRVLPAAGVGLNRPEEIPDEVDVLIIGSGPAGTIAAAQLSRFPGVTTRLIESNPGRLPIGRADGIQARSVETFQAFGFAEQVIQEAFHLTEMNFWKPDPADPSRIVRAARTVDDEHGISEFPHLIVNQSRLLDYFNEFALHSPTRLRPDYGVEFRSLQIDEPDAGNDFPVAVTIGYLADPRAGEERVIRAKYVLGADGARSKVRAAIGRKLVGQQANHAWGVLDTLANTDFPDIRTKCAIQSGSGGNILLIPREGGYLFRLYVDLGEVSPEDQGAVRGTSVDEIIAKANEILHPYTLDVRDIAWHSVYEVGHRVTDHFDDVPEAERGRRTPRVFIAGDACHTHSAKAGQGMNVSFQDGWNLAWKLGHVLEGRSPESLLATYSAERQVIAQNLIDFDREWSTLMARKPEEFENPSELEDFYVRTAEFPAGFLTQYVPSLVIGEAQHQALATGYPVGKRFKSARVVRLADANPKHLGHLAQADGRWRIYVFADAAHPGADSPTRRLAQWLAQSPSSPIVATPEDLDRNAWFDVKVIYQQPHTEFDLNDVPAVFTPRNGPLQLNNLENVFGIDPREDIFEARGIDRAGAVVVVRPDQYVANVLPLNATAELADFFAPILGR